MLIVVRKTIYYLLAILLMAYAYRNFIVPLYGYTGFEWYPNTNKFIEIFIIVCFIVPCLPKRFTYPSDILIHLQFTFPILSMLVLYAASDGSREYIYLCIISYLVMVLTSRIFSFTPFFIMKINPDMLMKLFSIISVCYIISIILQSGIKYFNIDIFQVYEFRSEAASDLPVIYGYLTPIVSKIIIPFALILAFYNKNYFYVVVIITMSFLVFAFTSHKSPLFYPIVTLFLFILSRNRDALLWLLRIIVFIILISILDFMFDSYFSIGNLILRRVFFVPALLNFFYYDFFSAVGNSFVYWSQSKVTLGLIDYNYNLQISNLIGYEYFSDSETVANTGWLGTGYVHLGGLGMLLYSIIIGIYLKIIDAYSSLINKHIIVSIIMPSMLALMTSTDLPTAFLTHGLLLILLVLSIMDWRYLSEEMKKEKLRYFRMQI